MAFQSSLLSIQRKCIRVGSTNRCRQTDCAFLYSPSLACFPDSSAGKESACNARDLGSIPGSARSPPRREWQPAPVFLPGEFHGQRSLAGTVHWVTESWTRLRDTHTRPLLPPQNPMCFVITNWPIWRRK